jgi:CRISPR-associated endonuclease/helicase Cas3
MKPTCWPTWLDNVWAKSAEHGGETLAEHTWDVLARLADFIHLRPALPESLGRPRLWHILFWATFLHDFGKAASGFQVMLNKGPRWQHRHEVLSLAFVDWITAGLTQDEQAWVAAAIASHHKDAATVLELYPVPDDPEDDHLAPRVAELDEATLRGLWRWLAECPDDWIATLGLEDLGVQVIAPLDEEQAVALVMRRGSARIYHWLKTYRRFVRQMQNLPEASMVVPTLALRGYLINSDHSASGHYDALPHVSLDADTILDRRQLERERLFEHQKDAEAVIGSALLIAPTGSGKTEAALLWAAAQANQGNVPRLFYTLPYQASMNAMKLRLEESFGADKVGLQHGRSLLANYRLLMESHGPEAAAQMSRLERNLAKLNYPPVRIFSPYQMLKGPYRLRGYEALLSDYHNAVFIFDEIHAYETGRLALILKTIEYLSCNFNARFLIMSATFPTLIKEWLGQALGSYAEITATPRLFEKFTRHKLMLLDGELLSEQGLGRIEADARAGKSVLVVCNVVKRAQEVYDQLHQRLQGSQIQMTLLHGRFNMRDRSEKEHLVREATGANNEQRQPIVLVATQAVEVSLDIDLDTIYTDPAPLEALVQRFGRVNRRGRKELAPVHVYRQPDDGQIVYNIELVQRTLAILERENGRPVAEHAIGAWLDEIYSGELAERLKQEYERASSEFEATCLRTLRPFQASRELETDFYRAFDGIDVLPASLLDEYEQLLEDDPILARELLVSIRWVHYVILAKKGLVVPADKEARLPVIVEAYYDSEVGLDLARSTRWIEDEY